MELAADDVADYFSAYGRVLGIDWIEDGSDNAFETMLLEFESGAAVTKALHNPRHIISRESDGSTIGVKVFVKFSDNVRS